MKTQIMSLSNRCLNSKSYLILKPLVVKEISIEGVRLSVALGRSKVTVVKSQALELCCLDLNYSSTTSMLCEFGLSNLIQLLSEVTLSLNFLIGKLGRK